MEVTIHPCQLAGEVTVPGSKSHTIRALVIASLARGRSRILKPLDSTDTRACLQACCQMGAAIEASPGEWTVAGTGGNLAIPPDVINVSNSGTTLNILMGTAALSAGWTILTGDEQIRSRPVGPLIEALNDLGAQAFSTRDNGLPPVVIRGKLRGGTTRIACPSSQYLTSLLLSCPLAEEDTEIILLQLNERPYVAITMDWLDKQGIRYTNQGLERFIIEGGQRYNPFETAIPGDFSSATFFLCAAAITGSAIKIRGLDSSDSQGDREVLTVLKKMGCELSYQNNTVSISGKDRKLRGATFDLNSIPDSLPALAVTACYAEGTTRLVNVPQARLKETDRISVMKEELTKMGAEIEELPDGLVINYSPLKGCRVNGHADHRVVMAMSVAGLAASGKTTVTTAEAAAVTFPDFFDLLASVRI